MEFIRVMLEQFIAEQRERNRRADHALATILNEQRHIKELIMATKDEVVADMALSKHLTSTTSRTPSMHCAPRQAQR